MRDKDKSRPEMFSTSKELTKMKQIMTQEHEYYCSFQRDLRDHIVRNKLSDGLKSDPECKPYLDLDGTLIRSQEVLQGTEACLLKLGTTFLKMILHNLDKITQQVYTMVIDMHRSFKMIMRSST